MINEISIDGIQKMLPHRYPFLLVDKILEYKKRESIRGIKNVTVNEPFFQGHFPNKLVMPGVLIIEAMAQVAALMGALELVVDHTSGDNYYLAGVDKIRFRKPVLPGDQLLIEATLINIKQNICKFKVTSKVDDHLVASGEILTAIAR